MDYNTQRGKLVMREYGRNIQRMVEHLKTIEDREERNRLAKAIIQVMGNINPHLRDVSDFTHKLWDHLAIISNFELDIDSPYPTPSKEEIYKKPERLNYQSADNIQFKHYGKIIQDMIDTAIDYPEGEEKNFLIEVICTQMKKSFVTWNRENVNDEQIFNDLLYLSQNKLKIPEGLKLKEARELVPKKKQTTLNKKGSGKDKKTQKRRKK